MNAIQSGPSIAKPVIHGLHSNRVLVINNGVRQEGQQWGAEHAPEVDPFIASQIAVIKGAASVRYGADAIGGVVSLSPGPLPTSIGIGGDVYAVGASNGSLGTLSSELRGAGGGRLVGLAYRIQGTYKRGGNFNAPDYVLKNTGLEETDGSAEVGYKRKRLDAGIYYSLYRTKNGIFEGSHVGNVADLFAAFNRAQPIAQSGFSYAINRSYQQVNHELAKGVVKYTFQNQGWVEATFARQRDLREEYDISLPYTNDPEILKKPQVSFQLITHTLEVVYHQPVRYRLSGSIGVAGATQGNVFKGIRYLIPNFRNYTAGLFAIERYAIGRLSFEAGIRYDYRWLRVYRLNNTTLQPYSATFDYNNLTGTVGATCRVSDKLNVRFNTGNAWRSPSVNELYIHGIHFSDARYQNGDSSLLSERSWNTSLAVEYRGKIASVDLDVYNNLIDNYIYERPLAQPVTLISGAYPAFQYTQDRAVIQGVDLLVDVHLTRYVSAQSKATIVRGRNLTQGNFLLYMPADRFSNGLTCALKKIGFLKEPFISLENVSVLRQWRVPGNSDYVAPPKGYSIFNANIGFATNIGKGKLTVGLAINNLANTKYRDYLNHFRYYSDELGVNFIIRTKLSF